MSDSHQALVYRIGEIKTHSNADKLELAEVGGYQIVIGKGQYKTGDLGVFIQPDSIVPQTAPFKFIWEKYAPFHLGQDGVVSTTEYDLSPESRRRIQPKRLRGEWSEGLFMPLSDFAAGSNGPGQLTIGGVTVKEGDDIAEAIGVTHYVPEFDRENTKADTKAAPKRKYPKTLKGWFYWTLFKLFGVGRKNYAMEVTFQSPVYDINALKNNKGAFKPGEQVQVTEKIHGSNGKFVVVDDVFYAGSHYQWLLDGPNVWWNVTRRFPEIEKWCRLNPGVVLYGEVGPTQKGFRYGAGDGEQFFFAFDAFSERKYTWAGNLGFAPLVPILYVGPFDIEKIKTLVDGDSVVPGAKNIREGVVIRSLETGRKMKVVSNAYLAKN